MIIWGSLRGILTSSWCEAREEVGPDATQKRQLIGPKNPRRRIHGYYIKLRVQNSSFFSLKLALLYGNILPKEPQWFSMATHIPFKNRWFCAPADHQLLYKRTLRGPPPKLALFPGNRIPKRASVVRGRSGPKNMIFIIPEPDDKARQKIDLKFFGCPWIFSYYIKIHSAGPSRSSVII